jgi:hypothetical protein
VPAQAVAQRRRHPRLVAYLDGQRYGGRIEDVIVVKVAVPRDWLRRHDNHNGLWRCTQDVAPQRFRGCRGFRELSASPIRGKVKVVER